MERPEEKKKNEVPPFPPPPPYLREVEPVERVTLLLHPLHRPRRLPHPLRLLRQEQVQHRRPPGAHVPLGQRVHHQHDPHGPLPLPVPRDGVEQVVGVEAAAALVGRHPEGHHVLDVVQVALEAAVQVPGQQRLQVLAVGQQLAAGQLGDGQRVGEVQLEENAAAAVEGSLGPLGDEVPDSGVGHVDGAKQVGGRVAGRASDFPQERVQVALLLKGGAWGSKRRGGGAERRKGITIWRGKRKQ